MPFKTPDENGLVLRPRQSVLTQPCNPSLDAAFNREHWLSLALAELAVRAFAPAGYQLPKNIRVSCSWPSRGGMGRKRQVLGQCWDASCSRDGFYEIYISPRIDDSEEVVAVLGHEGVHVVTGFKHGHRGPFRECATTIGLEGRMTATVAGDAFKRIAAQIIQQIGPYPHGAVDLSSAEPDSPESDPITTGEKPQKGRMRKGVCSVCGLTLRITNKWLTGRNLTCPDRDCEGREHPLLLS